MSDALVYIGSGMFMMAVIWVIARMVWLAIEEPLIVVPFYFIAGIVFITIGLNCK